jgi:hypothetical protein
MLLSKVSQFSRDAALARLMSGFGVTVVIQGDACPATDGKTVVLPPLKMDADEIDIAIHDFGVGHEPSHITEGSFDTTVEIRGFLHDIHNFLEDIRCEYSQEVTKYPGLQIERAAFYEKFRKYGVRMGTAKLIESATGKANVVRGGLCLLLLEARCKQLGVRHNMKPCPAVTKFYRMTLEQYLDRAATTKDVHETERLADEIHKAIGTGLDKADKQEGQGGYSPFSGVSEKTRKEDVLKDLENNGTPTPSDKVLEVMAGDSRTAPPQIDRKEVCRGDDEVHLVEETLARGIALLGAHGAMMTRLLVANSRPRTVRGRRDGRLDCRAVTEDHFDTRQDLYTHRVKGAVDKACVSFLLDVSGSMDRQAATQFAVVLGVGHYLERARVPFEISGFDNYFYPLKGFGEPMKGNAFKRLVPFAEGGTSLDAAMRAASRTLMARPERRKVFFVMSDGAADNLGYCKVLAAAMRSEGAVVVGVGIGCNLYGIFGDDSINLPITNMGEYLVTRLKDILGRKDRV